MPENNIILTSDSYKQTHHKIFPPGTENIFSYFESRGGDFPEVLFFGLQYLLKKYLSGQVVTKEKIDEAATICAAHFNNPELFNRAGWEYILEKHEGRLPVSIHAVPEGTLVPTKNVLMTLENTDPNCFWLTNFLETLLVQLWYPCTVATQSREMKLVLLQYLHETGDPLLVDFKLHDFGFRGVSSVETAGIGGCAHLVNFKGTDTMAGLVMARDYYDCPMAGYSIPASEHSTICAWGKEHEKEAFANVLAQYPNGLVACVSDSYDIMKACSDYWGKHLKEKVISRNGVLVIRPDSGDPLKTVPAILRILAKQLGGTIKNAKGYTLLHPKVRLIQGDGIDFKSMGKILEVMKRNKFSADNIAFGSGGGLLQKLNRDTLQFAFKCSSATVKGMERGVFKEPVGDRSKKSKIGRLKLVAESNTFKTVPQDEPGDDKLQEVFRDGKILVTTTLEEVRERAFAN